MDIKKLFDVSGKVALITGGSRGLGLEMGRALAQSGAKVALLGRREAYFKEARQAIPEALCIVSDVTDEKSLLSAIAETRTQLGSINILINAAGISWGQTLPDMPAEKIRQVLDINVTGTLLSCKALLPEMAEAGYGKIINVASIAGLKGEPAEILDATPYSASKGAVIALTRDLAVKWGPSGIRINALAPGFFPSRMTAALLDKTADLLSQTNPLRRIGQEGEVGAAGLYLASPASDFVTGHTLVVDGGATA